MSRYHFIKHFLLINKHKWFVFINCCKLGIPFIGLVHDLSKFSPSEFIKSSKYYKGTSSPVMEQRKNENLYSSICVHHVKRNKHHFEYRIDFYCGDLLLKSMPYKHALEYVADVIAASRAYNGINFKHNMPRDYFNARKDRYLMHSATKEFITILLNNYAENGFKNITKKRTKSLYLGLLKNKSEIERVKVLDSE